MEQQDLGLLGAYEKCVRAGAADLGLEGLVPACARVTSAKFYEKWDCTYQTACCTCTCTCALNNCSANTSLVPTLRAWVKQPPYHNGEVRAYAVMRSSLQVG